MGDSIRLLRQSSVVSGLQTAFAFSNSGNSLWRPGAIVQSGSRFYGITYKGGLGNGGIYKVNTDGTGYQALHAFALADGLAPLTPTVSGSTIFGVTQAGGSSSNGTVYRLATDGTGFQVLHNFQAADGLPTIGPVVESGGVLYGTTDYTIYKINIDGRLQQALFRADAGEKGMGNKKGIKSGQNETRLLS